MSAPTIGDVLKSFSTDALSPSELLGALLQRIEGLDDPLGVYVTVDVAGAQEQALAADRAWREGRPRPLEGVPLSVKDNLDVAGLPTTCCHARWRGAPAATRDAEAVRRLREAGAILVGKTQMHELALGITGENPAFRTARNPHDPSRVCGGSTSGGAASVSAGLALGALGSDMGGSIRVPAALCGLVGFKPTFDQLPREGLFPLASSMDHVGVITKNVADAARLCAALEPRAFSDEPAEAPTRAAMLAPPFEAAAFDVRRAVESAIALLAEGGVEVQVVPFARWDELAATYGTIGAREAAWTHRDALRHEGERARFGQDVLALLEAGLAVSDEAYERALRRRRELAGLLDACVEEHGLLLSPTTLVTAPLIGARHVEIGDRRVETRHALLATTCPFSMVGLPAISLPLHPTETSPRWRSDRLPIGLQLVGARGADRRLMRHAHWVEDALVWR